MRKAQGLYIISVAAQILDMHPQTLRKYERAGFIEPPRLGTLRLYSEEDIARLRLIKHLVEEVGLNLAGVELALTLASKLLALRGKLAAARQGTDERTPELALVDGMLRDLGLKAVDRDATSQGGRPETSGQGSGRSEPGERASEGPNVFRIAIEQRPAGRSRR